MERSGVNPVPPLSGVECLAVWLIRLHTQVISPNFYTYVNEEHTPINLLDSHWNLQRRDDATIISTTEDPEGFPQTRSIQQQQQANRSKQSSTM